MTDFARRLPKGWDWRDGFSGDPLALDDDTAERMLRGTVAPDDAPPGYSRVSEVVTALTTTPTADETSWQRFGYPEVGMHHSDATTLTMTHTRPQVARRHRLRVMTAALVSSVVVFGSLAAAGALPNGAQRLAANVLDQIGVAVPAPDTHTNPPAVDGSGSGSTSSHSTGDATADAAHDGQSTVTDANGNVVPSSTEPASSKSNNQGTVNPPHDTKAPKSTSTQPTNPDQGGNRADPPQNP